MNQNPIKLYVLAGFLGSGKTTLLKNLLNNCAGLKVGVIMNEFGKEGIDGTLVKQNGIDMMELNNGSIYCSCLKASFVDGLAAFADLPMDLLFVEGSGLADPSNMPAILELVAMKAGRDPFDYLGSVCIIDALHFSDYHDIFPAIEKQITGSNLIIINKIDLAEPDEVTEIETIIRQLNPLAELIHTTYCQFDLRSLDQLMTQAPLKENQPTVNSPENRPNSFVLRTEGTFARERFHDFLSAVGKDAYRMKGFFHLEEGWHQVDVVGTQIRMNPTEHTEENSRLVIISNIGLPIIRKIFHHWEHRFTEKITLR